MDEVSSQFFHSFPATETYNIAQYKLSCTYLNRFSDTSNVARASSGMTLPLKFKYASARTLPVDLHK